MFYLRTASASDTFPAVSGEDETAQTPIESRGLSDQQVTAKWSEIAHLIEVISTRIEDPNDFTVHPSSDLAEDNAASKPYHLSHCAQWCLNAGVDNLHALKMLVVGNGALHSTAPYNLARGALENFGAGFWMLHPSDRKVRVERGLRWWSKNFKDQHRASRGLTNHTPLTSRLDSLSSLAEAAECDLTRIRDGYSSTEALKYSQEHSSANGPYLVWQVCSGFAHGRPWANIAMNAMENRGSPEEGVALVRLTTDHKRLLAVTLPAMHLLTDSLRLYQDQGRITQSA